MLFVAAFLMGLAAPVLALAGALEPVALVDESIGHTLGFVLYFVGLAGALLAQVAMGASWRIGVA